MATCGVLVSQYQMSYSLDSTGGNFPLSKSTSGWELLLVTIKT